MVRMEHIREYLEALMEDVTELEFLSCDSIQKVFEPGICKKNGGFAGTPSGRREEIPEDIRAFFGHPLTAATSAIDGDDAHASALALLHEYQNLPAIDRSDMKIGDKFGSLNDILSRPDLRKEHGIDLGMFDTNVDEFLNRAAQEEKENEATALSTKSLGVGAKDLTPDQTSIKGGDSPPSSTCNGSVVHNDVSLANGAESESPDAGNSPLLHPASDIDNSVDSLTAQRSPSESAFPESTTQTALSPTTSDTSDDRGPCDSQQPRTDTGSNSAQCTQFPFDNEPVALLSHPPPRYEDVASRSQSVSSRSHSLASEKSMADSLPKIKQEPTSPPPPTPTPAGSVKKPSDSTKRIIQVLTAKIKKKQQLALQQQQQQQKEQQQKKQQDEDNHTLFNEINAIIKNEVKQTDCGTISTQHQPQRTESFMQELTRSGGQTAHYHTNMASPMQQPQHKVQTATNPVVDSYKAVDQSQTPRPDWIPVPGSGPYECWGQRLTAPAAHTHSQAALASPGSGAKPRASTGPGASPVPAPAHQSAPASIYHANFYPGGIYPAGNFPQYRHMSPGQALPMPGGALPAQPTPTTPESATTPVSDRYGRQQSFAYPQVLPETYNLKSPDSGFNESCISPTEQTAPVGFPSGDQSPAPNEAKGKAMKRRRSSSLVMKTFCNVSKLQMSPTVIPKLDPDPTGYKYFLETPTSTSQRIDEDKITYLNKGQFYGLTLDYQNGNRPLRCNTVKSIIMVLFREDKNPPDEVKAWDFWHSRQHSIKQRIIDIDTKNSTGILTNCIDEVAHNAVVIRWNPKEQAAKVNIAINCLSTDFSNQKGVKGLPLHVQIDTYEDTKDQYPIHRGYCQIKVFCDKGAERKTRDEERRKDTKGTTPTTARKKPGELFHPVSERSEFYSMAILTKQPFLFNPVPDYEEYMHRTSPLGLNTDYGDRSPGTENIDSTEDKYNDLLGPPAKIPRRSSSVTQVNRGDLQYVLLYVRENHENAFTALLLYTPTLEGLANAIEEKYKIPAARIKNVYKRSKKGILVKMDDNIIRHYSNESTFTIEIRKKGDGTNHLDYDVTLTEFDAECM